MRVACASVLVAVAALTVGVFAVPAVQDASLQSDFVASTVTELAAVINREYFDPEVAAKVDAGLRQSLAQGRYNGIATREILARTLTTDLLALGSDQHLFVAAVPDSGPASAQVPSDEARALAGKRSNFGVNQVEILPGNIGYLDLTSFYRPDEARDAIDAAMRFLKNTDALIVDLRSNTGGSPETVTIIAGYFFDTPGLPLFDIAHRPPDAPDHYATPAARLPGSDHSRPMFLLTSTRTFSAGEGLAFLLQERRRALVVGQQTSGAANPGKPYPVNPQFVVNVPNGRVRSAVNGKNWEGVGVTPDIAAQSATALRVAYTRALTALLARQQPGPWRETLTRALNNVNRSLRNR
jgi:hypothetical protein